LLQLESLNLLGPVKKEHDVPRKIYIVSLLEPEVSFLALYLQRFAKVLSLGAGDFGENDDAGLIMLVSEWNNLRKCNKKLRILLKFFEGALGLACLQTILEVDPTEYPSHHSCQVFWRLYFDSELFQVDFKEAVAGLEAEYDLHLQDKLDVLRSTLSSKHQIVTIFRLDAVAKTGLHNGIYQLIREVGKKESIQPTSTKGAATAAAAAPLNQESLLDPAVIWKSTDREEIRKYQREILRRMVNVEETTDNLAFNRQQLLLVLNDVEAFFASTPKDIINKDFKARKEREEELLVAQRKLYLLVLGRLTELDESDQKQRLLLGEDFESELTVSIGVDSHSPSLPAATGRSSISSNRPSLLGKFYSLFCFIFSSCSHESSSFFFFFFGPCSALFLPGPPNVKQLKYHGDQSLIWIPRASPVHQFCLGHFTLNERRL